MNANFVKSVILAIVIGAALSGGWSVKASDDLEWDRLIDRYIRAQSLAEEDKAFEDYQNYMKKKKYQDADSVISPKRQWYTTYIPEREMRYRGIMPALYEEYGDELKEFGRSMGKDMAIEIGFSYLQPSTGNSIVDEATRDFATGTLERVGGSDVGGQMVALNSYGKVVATELSGMMSSSLADARRLSASSDGSSDTDWILESRQNLAELQAQSQMQEIAWSSAASSSIKPARPSDWLDPNDPFARAKQVEAGRRKPPQGSLVGTRASPSSQAEKWQKLNAAMDAYEQEKGAPANRASEGFTLESEKQSYNSVLQGVGAENNQQGIQVEQQKIKAAQLQGEVQDLNERIANKTAAIEQMKQKLGELKARANDADAVRNRTQAENRQLQQEMNQLDASIKAEEASVQAMQSQQSSSMDTLNTVLGGLSLAGNLAGVMNSISGGGSAAAGRSQAASDTASYASSSSGRSGSAGGTSSVATRGSVDDGSAQAIADEMKAQAIKDAWIANQMKGRYGSSGVTPKIREYRKNYRK